MKKIFTALTLVALAGAANAADKPADAKSGVARYEIQKQEAIAKLPKDKADMFKKVDADQKAKSKEIFKKIRALRKEQREIMKSAKFDKDAYLKKSAEISKLEAEKANNRANAIAELGSKFSPSEREVLISVFDHSGRRANKEKNS